jgi:hypothetical protein
MSRPSIHTDKLNEHLTISECHPDSECRTNNWWLYDDRAGMNIGIREKTRDEAFVEAIEYWAERAIKYEKLYLSIRSKVDSFVGQFIEQDD